MLALPFNAALEECILAYRMSGKSISLYDQYQSLTKIRREAAEWRISPFCWHALRWPVWAGR